jgi:hypothetical protein
VRRARLVALFLLAGGIASLVGGFCTVVVLGAILSVAEAEPLALMPGALFAGVFGAVLGLKAFVPATLLGGLLWSFRLRSKLVWAGTGLLGGLGMFGALSAFPTLAGGLPFDANWQFALAFALAGAPAACAFRLVMESATAFDDDAPMLD